MENLFANIVLGHLTADYLLQSKKMALKKSNRGLNGFLWCLGHCLIYTAIICLFIKTASPLAAGLVFLSHFPVDRWSLAEKWLKLIHGRNVLAAYNSQEHYHEIDLAFSCLVYAVTDNTMHLVLLWWMFQ